MLQHWEFYFSEQFSNFEGEREAVKPQIQGDKVFWHDSRNKVRKNNVFLIYLLLQSLRSSAGHQSKFWSPIHWWTEGNIILCVELCSNMYIKWFLSFILFLFRKGRVFSYSAHLLPQPLLGRPNFTGEYWGNHRENESERAGVCSDIYIVPYV